MRESIALALFTPRVASAHLALALLIYSARLPLVQLIRTKVLGSAVRVHPVSAGAADRLGIAVARWMRACAWIAVCETRCGVWVDIVVKVTTSSCWVGACVLLIVADQTVRTVRVHGALSAVLWKSRSTLSVCRAIARTTLNPKSCDEDHDENEHHNEDSVHRGTRLSVL